MPLFRYGARAYKAMQYDGRNAMSLGFLVSAEEFGEDLLGDFMSVTLHGREIQIEKGQWLINDDGRARVLDDEVFRKYYKEVVE